MDDVSTDNQTQLIDEQPQSEDSSQVRSLIAIESLIKTYVLRIKSAQEEQKRLKEMYDGILENDEEYSKASDLAKQAGEAKAKIKKDLLSKAEHVDVVEKYETARTELSELKQDLSAKLRDYERLANTNQIEVGDGDMREIVYTAKLVKSTAVR